MQQPDQRRSLTSAGNINGPVQASSLSASGATALNSTLSVGGTSNFTGTASMGTVNMASLSVGSSMTCTPNAYFSSFVFVNQGVSVTGGTATNGISNSGTLSSTGAISGPVAATTLSASGASTFNGNMTLTNGSNPSLSIINTPGSAGGISSINVANYTGYTNGFPITMQFVDNNYSADLVVLSKTSGAAGNSQVERFRINNAGLTSMTAATIAGTLNVSGAATAAALTCSSLTTTGTTTLSGVTNTGTITSNGVQITTIASGQIGQKVYGPGGGGTTLAIDWSTFAVGTGSIPTWRWLLTDSGSGSSSLALQAAPTGQTSSSTLATALTFAAGTGAATFAQPLTAGSSLGVTGTTTLGGTLSVSGATAAAAITCSNLTASGTSSLNTLTVTALTVGSSMTCAPNAAFSSNVSVNQGLTVQGGTTTSGIANTGAITSGSLQVSGGTTTNGITNTGAVSSSSVQITATASGQSAEKVYGSGGSGVTVFVDWSTFTPSAPSPLPTWRWLLTDAGNGSSSLALQVAPGPQSSNSVMSTALTLAAGTGNATFTQPFTLSSTLSVSGAATMGSISAAAITVAGQTTLNGAMTCAGNATLSSSLTVTGTSSMTGAVTVAAASSLQAPYVLSNATGSGGSQVSTVGPGDRFLLYPPLSGSRPFGLGFNSAQVRMIDAVSGSGVWYTMPGNVNGSHRFELGSTVYLEVSQTGVTAPQGSFYVNGSGSPLAGLVTEVPSSSAIVVNTQVNYRGVTAQANAGAAARIDTRGTSPFQWSYRAAGTSTETQLAQIDSSGNLTMLAGVNATAISGTVVTATSSTVYLGNNRAGLYRTGGANPVTYLQANDTITPDTTLVGGAFLVDTVNSRFSWQARAANSSTDTTVATLSFTTGTLQASGGFAGPVAATTLSASAATTLSSTLAVSGATTTAGIANTGTISSTGAFSGPVAATTLSASGAAFFSGATTAAALSCTTLSASGAATLSSTLVVSGTTTTAGITNTGQVTTGSLTAITTGSGQTLLRVAGPGSGGTTVAIDWSTFNNPGGAPCWRWLLTDSGSGSSSLALQGLPNGGSAVNTALSFAASNGGATFLQPFTVAATATMGSTLAVTGAATLSSTLAVAGTSAFNGNITLTNGSSPSLNILNTAGAGVSSYINAANYTGYTNGYPLTLQFLDNNYSADFVVLSKTPGSASNSQGERFRISNAGAVSMAGQLSSGYHYITGVDGNSRSLVSLASGNSQNSIVWGQALSNNNSAVIGYNNATASTVQLGIYGSTPLSVDANGTTKVARLQVGTSTDTARQISCLQSGLTTNSSSYITVGQDASNNNQTELAFAYVGSGSSSNKATLGLYGAPVISVDGGGNLVVPGGMTANNTATIIGTTSRQITCKNSSTNTTQCSEAYYDCTAAGSSAQSAFGVAGPAASAISNGNAPTRGAYWWVNGADRININPSTGAVAIGGALSKGSGTFQIRHPLAPRTTDLVHSFVEGPRCDLIYRGRTRLSAGEATVEIDAECTGNGRGMRRGTFEVLCRNPQVYLQNNATWAKVRGRVEGGLLYVSCEEPAADCVIDWMVVAERQDEHVRQWDKTDPEGHLVLEWER